jgi:RNase adaptor protein for sRNA GlmZ degradation
MSLEKTTVQILEEQRRRHASLLERRTRAQVRLENEKKVLKEAQEEAMRLFGTSDLTALRTMYKDVQAENENKVMDFIFVLDEVESSLVNIERQISF